MSDEVESQSAAALADADDWVGAVAAQRAALAAGRAAADGREMLGWYLLRAGEREEADTVWAELLAARPGDADLLLTAGTAYAQADVPDRAADLLQEVLVTSLRDGAQPALIEEALDLRQGVLDALGREREGIDELAEEGLARVLGQVDLGVPIPVPWHPREEYARALAELPAFAAAWREHDHLAYSHELDRRMRAVAAQHGRTPIVVPIEVAQLLAFAASSGAEVEWAETRARVADERREHAIPWPPGRNELCWCGSGAKHKRCCGR